MALLGLLARLLGRLTQKVEGFALNPHGDGVTKGFMEYSFDSHAVTDSEAQNSRLERGRVAREPWSPARPFLAVEIERDGPVVMGRHIPDRYGPVRPLSEAALDELIPLNEALRERLVPAPILVEGKAEILLLCSLLIGFGVESLLIGFRLERRPRPTPEGDQCGNNHQPLHERMTVDPLGGIFKPPI